MKRKISDFTFAFTLALIVFSALALLSQQNFFEGIFTVGENKGEFTLFDMRFSLNRGAYELAHRLFSQNSIFFGTKGVEIIKGCGEYVFSFAADVLNIIFLGLKDVVGLAC